MDMQVMIALQREGVIGVFFICLFMYFIVYLSIFVIPDFVDCFVYEMVLIFIFVIYNHEILSLKQFT